jgi:cell division inhibitor SepF
MGKLIQGFLNSLKLTDEEDYDDDEDFDIVMDNSRKREVVPKRENPPLRKYEDMRGRTDKEEEEDEYDDEPIAQRRTFNSRPSGTTSPSRDTSFGSYRPQSQRPSSSGQSFYSGRTSQSQRNTVQQPQSKTAVPLRSSLSDRRIYVLNPKSFEEAKEVSETVKGGGVIFLNFEGVRVELAQRLMDFAGGAVYALGGQIYQITGYNFIAAPGDVDIEGDILAQITLTGSDFPTFNKY